MCSARRRRADDESSNAPKRGGIDFPYRNGFAAYGWVMTPNGRRTRKYVYGRDRADVHAKWIKLQEVAAAGSVATSVPTVSEYLSFWLEEVIGPHRAPLTYATYGTFIRLHINPDLGDERLNKLQRRDVQTWINRLARTWQCCKQGKDARRPEDQRRCCAIGKCCHAYLSARTVSDAGNALRAALSYAQAGAKKATPQDRKWPLSWVGVAGFEPTASSSRTACTAVLEGRSGC
jgi:hypothetical protein